MTDVQDQETTAPADRYKIRWALVSYTTPTHPQKLVFRGMVVDDLGAELAADLVAQGAIVAADADLDRPGELEPLPTAPSNEELMNWVMGASQVEIDQEIARNPMMAQRLREAHAVYAQMTRDQLELLGQRVTSLPQVEAAEDATVETTQPVGDPLLTTSARSLPSSSAQISEKQPLEEVPQTEMVVNADYFDQVVKANVEDVSQFLSQYPQYAQPVLEAEQRRADAERAAGNENAQPRKGVENAVEAAAGFSQ